MKHFWLDDDQQVLMDGATSTASQFTHIGLFQCGKAWKRLVEGMVGSKVDPENYLRTFKVTGQNTFYPTGYHLPGQRFDAAIRMTDRQAMMFKLKYQGSAIATVLEDPTGEYWGNMLISQAGRNRQWIWGVGYHYGMAEVCMTNFIAGNGFGPTLGNVGNSCAGLPQPWARALVWAKAAHWHQSGLQVSADIPAPVLALADAAENSHSAFDYPAETYGQVVARAWWQQCQYTSYRVSVGANARQGESMDPI